MISINFLISSTLLLSSISCLITTSWLTIWIFLELNTLAFCSLIYLNNNSLKSENEGLINYLIVQSLSSMVLILASASASNKSNWVLLFLCIALLALLLNIAAAPFHEWYLEVVNNISLNSNLILFSWQNIAPSYLLIFQLNNLIFPFVIITGVLGTTLIINNKALNEILGLSSVFNLSWGILSILVNLNTFLLFTGIYWITLSFPILQFMNNDNSILTEYASNNLTNTALLVILASLAGLPPLTGFVSNWVPLIETVNIHILPVSIFLLLISSINLWVYLRIINSSLLSNTDPNQTTNNTSDNSFVRLFWAINGLTLSYLVI